MRTASRAAAVGPTEVNLDSRSVHLKCSLRATRPSLEYHTRTVYSGQLKTSLRLGDASSKSRVEPQAWRHHGGKHQNRSMRQWSSMPQFSLSQGPSERSLSEGSQNRAARVVSRDLRRHQMQVCPGSAQPPWKTILTWKLRYTQIEHNKRNNSTSSTQGIKKSAQVHILPQ